MWNKTLRILAIFHKIRDLDGVIVAEAITTFKVDDFSYIQEGIVRVKSNLLVDTEGHSWITHQIIVR